MSCVPAIHRLEELMVLSTLHCQKWQWSGIVLGYEWCLPFAVSAFAVLSNACTVLYGPACLALFQLDADVELNVPVQVLDDASAVPEEDGYGELWQGAGGSRHCRLHWLFGWAGRLSWLDSMTVLNSHWSGALTAVFGCCIAGAVWNRCWLCVHHRTMHKFVVSLYLKSCIYIGCMCV